MHAIVDEALKVGKFSLLEERIQYRPIRGIHREKEDLA
jgi:hypothetical protein